MPLLAIPAILLVLIFPLLFQPFPLVLPLPFLTPILLSQLFLTSLNPVQVVFQEEGSPEVGKGGGVEATPIILLGNLIPTPLFSTPHFPAILPFLPQTLFSLDISDIFVLMVPLICLPNPKFPTIPLKELWLILSSNQTSLSLRSFPQWLPLILSTQREHLV